MTYEQKQCPLCGRDMTAIETYPGRGELYCGHCDLTIGGNDAKTPEELIALMDSSEHRRLKTDNAKLREQLESLQPTDCEGNALDIADTVSMLRSEYDGDHEWDDVVVELALTKWGGDRWIVRGSKGEAWACDCTKTGYDEDAYEGSDDVEPIDNPTLVEAENAKLRELAENLLMAFVVLETPKEQQKCIDRAIELWHELNVLPMETFDAGELGMEVDE